MDTKDDHPQGNMRRSWESFNKAMENESTTDPTPEQIAKFLHDADVEDTLFCKEKTQNELRQLGVLSIDITQDQITHAVPLEFVERVLWTTEDNCQGTVRFTDAGHTRYLTPSFSGFVRLRVTKDAFKKLHSKALHTERIARALESDDLEKPLNMAALRTTIYQPQLIKDGVLQIHVGAHQETKIFPIKHVRKIKWDPKTKLGCVHLNQAGIDHGYYTRSPVYTGSIELVKNIAFSGDFTTMQRTDDDGKPTSGEHILQPTDESGFTLGRPPTKLNSFVAQVEETIKSRQAVYASPSDNHQLTQQLCGLWHKYRQSHAPQSAHMTEEDICVFNIIQKLARLANGTHDDSYVDIIGYSENVAMLKPEQRNRK